ncbi:MAG: hypothetical protein EXR91_12540 [Gemmatimonadetes bacterium]|nr:hypothetical protein [Gemmatimonadota bacterium]
MPRCRAAASRRPARSRGPAGCARAAPSATRRSPSRRPRQRARRPTRKRRARGRAPARRGPARARGDGWRCGRAARLSAPVCRGRARTPRV